MFKQKYSTEDDDPNLLKNCYRRVDVGDKATAHVFTRISEDDQKKPEQFKRIGMSSLKESVMLNLSEYMGITYLQLLNGRLVMKERTATTTEVQESPELQKAYEDKLHLMEIKETLGKKTVVLVTTEF